MSRSVEAILNEARKVQTVKNRAESLIKSCDKRAEELKQEMDQRNADDGLMIVLNDVLYEFSDAERARNALCEAADKDYMTDIVDGVYWAEVD